MIVQLTLLQDSNFYFYTRRPDAEETCVKDIDLGGENHFHLEVTPSYIHCVNASILSLEHEMDPTLTVMLTMVSLEIQWNPHTPPPPLFFRTSKRLRNSALKKGESLKMGLHLQWVGSRKSEKARS